MKRREELEQTLAIHTNIGIREANLKLDSVEGKTDELDRKYVP
jgi:hypothetical protein